MYWEVFRKKLKTDNIFSKDNHEACTGYLLIDKKLEYTKEIWDI